MAACLHAECAKQMETVREVVCKDCREYMRWRVYWYTVPKALCLAAVCGHIKCVKRVVKTTGADVNKLNRALRYGVVKGIHETIGTLIE